MSEPIFVDTLFVVALINYRDAHHAKANELANDLRNAPLVTTDAILLEIGNGLARGFKTQAMDVIHHFQSSAEVEVVALTPSLLHDACALYQSHSDKEWGLVDCVSFVVMRQMNISAALTYDQHFVQAGFRALMRA